MILIGEHMLQVFLGDTLQFLLGAHPVIVLGEHTL